MSPKNLMGIIAVIALIAIKIVMDLGSASTEVVSNQKTPEQIQAEIAASHNQKWPENFKKEFLNSCTTTTPMKHERAIVAYCLCVTDKIESAHIIPTKFDRQSETELHHAQRVASIVKDYMLSTNGKELAQSCNNYVRLSENFY